MHVLPRLFSLPPIADTGTMADRADRAVLHRYIPSAGSGGRVGQRSGDGVTRQPGAGGISSSDTCFARMPLRLSSPRKAGTHTPCLIDELRPSGPGSVSAFTRVFDALWVGTTAMTALPSTIRSCGMRNPAPPPAYPPGAETARG